MLPPYPTTLSDLQTRSNQVVILVQNLSRQSYTFVLGGELTDDNGVSLKAVPFVGQTTLTVNALQSLRLSANDFSRIFDINKIQVSGIDKNTLIRTGAIPEGSYRLCLRAYDPATLRPISDEEPLGCSNTFPIQSIEPPIILRPQNETEVMVSTPQNIQFAWTVPAQAPAGTRYIFRIKELLNGQNPNNIMRLGTPYILEQQTNVNFFNYGPSFPLLVAGRSYAFSVQAVDPTGRTSFRNQGYSEVYQFIYKTPVVRSTDNAIAILVPQKCGSEIKAGENIAFYLRWKPEKATVPERYNLLITNSQKSVMVNKTLSSPYFQEDDMSKLRFNNGATYNFKIQQLDPSNNLVIAEQSCDFVFKKKDSVLVVAQRHIKGKMQYAYPNKTNTYQASNADLALYLQEVIPKGNNDYRVLNEKLIAQTTTLSDGSFDFGVNGFNEANGPTGKTFLGQPISTIFKIVSNNPYYKDYANAVMFNSKDGNIDLGLIKTEAKGFQLKVLLQEGYKNINKKELLENRTIYLYRLKKTSYSNSGSWQVGIGVNIPNNFGANISNNTPGLGGGNSYVGIRPPVEGMITRFTSAGAPSPLVDSRDVDMMAKKSSNYELIGTGKTNSSGETVFENLLCKSDDNDVYYLWTNEMDIKDAQPFFANYFASMNTLQSTTLTVISPLPPSATLAGKIISKYSDPNETDIAPLSNTTVKAQVMYVMKNAKGVNYNISDQHSISPDGTFSMAIRNNYNFNGQPEYADSDMIIGTGKTTNDGSFSMVINFDKMPKWGLVKKNMTIGNQSGEFPSYVTGDLYRYIRIVVESPYYCSPDDNIEIYPLESKNVGTLLSLVQSFSIEVAVKSNSDPNQASPNSPLSGMDVFLLRAWKSRPAGVPQNEGMHLNTYASDNNGKGYEIISKDITNGSGKVVLKRLIRHSGIASDVYYLAVQSNPNAGTNNTYGNLDKSDKSDFPSDFVGILISQDNEKTNNAFGSYTFNSEYNHFQNSTTRIMNPAKPRLSYRVVRKDKATDGIAGASASVIFKKLFSTETISNYSDKDGYVIFNNLPTGLQSKLTISHPSYDYETQDQYTESLPALKNGVQLVQKEIPFTPKGLVVGTIVNEESKGIGAYVKIDKGPYVESSPSNGIYFTYAIPKKISLINVIPKDVSYFEENSWVTIPDGVKVLDKITVYQRNHRIKFRVMGETQLVSLNPNGKITTKTIIKTVEKASVDILGQVFYADKDGWVEAQFKNVSVNYLQMKISGPAKTSYIPQTIAFTNEESRNYQIYDDVVLKNGFTVAGKVLLNGKPIKGAEVSMTAGINGSIYATQSESDGSFKLSYPEASTYTRVVATYNPDDGKSYIGDEVYVNTQNANNVTLNVKESDFNITDLWGFPIKIEQAQKQANGNLLVRGTLYLSKPNGSSGIIQGPGGIQINTNINNFNAVFKPFDNDMKIAFFGAEFSKVGNKVVCVSQKVSLQHSFLKMRYSDTYNTKTVPANSDYYLSIVKSGNQSGVVNGLTQVIDNSFKYPSSHLEFDDSEFYFAINSDGNINRNIPIISSLPDIPSKFNLCNKQGNPIKFKFIGFDAQAQTATSTISGSKIILDVSLDCKIPNANPSAFKLNVGKIELTADQVKASTGQSMTFKLAGKWSVEVKNWSISPTEGGIFSSNGIIKTGKIDVPFTTFMLRSNLLDISDFKVENLNVAGIAQLQTNVSGDKIYFGYDAKTGSDASGHWKLSIPSGNGGYAGKIKKEDLVKFKGFPNQDITLSMISLLDNGEDILSFSNESSNYKLFNLVNFKPNTINTGADYFSLVGSGSLGIQRVANDQMLVVKFVKSTPAIQLSTFDLGFEAKGYVRFSSVAGTDKQTFDNGRFVATGKIEEPGKLQPIKVALIHTPTETKIVPVETEFPNLPKQSIPIGGSGANDTKLRNIALTLTASPNQDWSFLTFEGDLDNYKGTQSQPNRMKFTVFGEIKASDQKIQADNLPSLPGLQLTYDIEKKRLVGTIDLSKLTQGVEGLEMKGVAQVLFDPQGWIITAAGIVSNVPLPDPTVLKAGLLIGSYSQALPTEASSVLFTYVREKQLPCSFAQGFAGFYVTGERPMPLDGLSMEIDLVIASAYFNIDAFMDTYFYGNLFGTVDFGAGIRAKVHADYGLKAITCTSLTGSVDAEAAIKIQVKKQGGSFSANLNAKLGNSNKICLKQEIPLLFDCGSTIFDDCLEKGFCVSFSGGTSGVSADLSLSPCKTEPCK